AGPGQVLVAGVVRPVGRRDAAERRDAVARGADGGLAAAVLRGPLAAERGLHARGRAVLRGADADTVLVDRRGPDHRGGEVVAVREADQEVLVVPHELVDAHRQNVVVVGRGTPRVGRDARGAAGVALVSRTEQQIEVARGADRVRGVAGVGEEDLRLERLAVVDVGREGRIVTHDGPRGVRAVIRRTR